MKPKMLLRDVLRFRAGESTRCDIIWLVPKIEQCPCVARTVALWICGQALGGTRGHPLEQKVQRGLLVGVQCRQQSLLGSGENLSGVLKFLYAGWGEANRVSPTILHRTLPVDQVSSLQIVE
jgi:hypothetical protein